MFLSLHADSPRQMDGTVHGLYGHDPTTSPTPTTIAEVHDQMDELADFLRAKIRHIDSCERASAYSSSYDRTARDIAAGVKQPGQHESLENEDVLHPGYRARRLASGLLERAADDHEAQRDVLSPKRHVAVQADEEGMTAADRSAAEINEVDDSILPEGTPPASSDSNGSAPDQRQPPQTKVQLHSKLYPEHDSPVARAQRASRELERLLARSSAEAVALSPRRLDQAPAEKHSAAEAARARIPQKAPMLSPTTHGAASAVREAALAKQRVATKAAIAKTASPTPGDSRSGESMQELLRRRHEERDADIVSRSARRQAEIAYRPSDSPRFFGRATSPTSLAEHAKASADAAAASAERLLAPSPVQPQKSSSSLVEVRETVNAASEPATPISAASASLGGLEIDWAALRSPQSVVTLSPSTFAKTTTPEPAKESESHTQESQSGNSEGMGKIAQEIQSESSEDTGKMEGERAPAEYQGRSSFLWRDVTPKTAHLAWTPTRQSTLRALHQPVHESQKEMTTGHRERTETSQRATQEQTAMQHAMPPSTPLTEIASSEARAHSPASKAAADADRRLKALLAASPRSTGR